ncbi:MAG: DUF4837 family protein [Prevotellaceae bacterium]|jgi:hypothetical protein|nr:DUF4837 family protein [Prevotellaceae bacterium]
MENIKIFTLKLLTGIFAVLALASCGGDSGGGAATGKSPRPSAIGKVGEIMVVIGNPDWDSELGDTIRAILQTPYPMLPQHESSFSLIQVSNSALNSVMRKHRNILLISIAPENQEPKLTIVRDPWANPQIVITAFGTDIQSIAKLLSDKSNAMINLYEQAELDRQTAISFQYADEKNVDTVKKRFGIDLSVPTGYYLMRNDSDFLWFESQTSNTSVGLFVYSFPAVGDSSLTVNYLIEKRNSILKEKVHGARDSSWMTTTDFITPELEIKNDKKNNRQYGEIRGLWELVNDYMGGAFLSRSYIDKQKNIVITVEGYVYAPLDKKRDFVRKIAGIINTLDL